MSIEEIFNEAKAEFGIEYPVKLVISQCGGGCANSIFNTVHVDSRSHRTMMKFIIYHELAHIVDRANQKVGFTTTCKILFCGVFGYSLSLFVNGSDSLKFIGSVAGNITGFLWGISDGRESEHRANIMACEKLIERGEYSPILYYLLQLDAHMKNGKIRTHHSHPTAFKEKERIVEYLKSKNIEIKSDGQYSIGEQNIQWSENF